LFFKTYKKNLIQYFIIYKPFQVLSQFTSDGNKKCLKDLYTIENDIYPVGRLDYDSEGLLILTNDTFLNAALLHPTKHIAKTYYVQVEGIATMEQINILQKGVTISVDGKLYQTKKCLAKIIEEPVWLPERQPPIRFRKNVPTSWISITITEGKNRQVRKMTAAVGLPTLRLVRYSIENITIEKMQSGEIQSINQKELYKLLNR
jgi:23S rRNA pseudouridine2457 synthase